MKTYRMAVIPAFVCGILSSAAFAAPEQALNVTGGSVSFLAVGRPSAIKIRGNGSAPQGDIHVAGKDITGELTFALDSLNTGIDLRDHHMKEKYLQTDKNPTAKFKITKLTLPAPFSESSFKADNIPVEGELTLHGVTQPAKGTATIACNSGNATGHVEFSTNISDYKIEIPNYMGIKVADHVDIQVDLQAKPTLTQAAAAAQKTSGTQKK
jgi:polyisoprenoid-binding protein YceI